MKATDVCDRAGVTYRQVDYWSRAGLLSPGMPGSGSRRDFTDEDLRRALIARAVSAQRGAARLIDLVLAVVTVSDRTGARFVMVTEDQAVHALHDVAEIEGLATATVLVVDARPPIPAAVEMRAAS